MFPRFLFPLVIGLLIFALLFAAKPRVAAPQTVVFLGDSITNRGLRPNGYIDLIRQELTKRGKIDRYKFIGAGHEGNTVLDLVARVDQDVVAQKPDLVFIYIGMNDVWKVINNPPTHTPINKYEAGLIQIINKIKATGAKVVLCTPSVIGEKKDGANPQDTLLEQYAQVSQRVARQTLSPVSDLRKAFKKYLQKHNPENQEKGILTIDRVHLSNKGNELVANQRLKYFK